ncbi:PREDICTED: mannose/glucose-specific lectin-like [Nicotiana attenuata]|uniref:mannose/glucose-specific lectin-like n=1 Tax=Nicotiana attenuata TaxID=49451 RepID=UPI000905551A|nr:PREDICTED: mannose/glucose-specific lectin-like [Nicotiana attenuata]
MASSLLGAELGFQIRGIWNGFEGNGLDIWNEEGLGNQVSYDQVDSILVEPWGGKGGSEWNYKLKSPIKEIVIASGAIIDSIMFRTVTSESTIVYSPKFGGNDGGRRDNVNIEATPLEYLKGIKGTSGHYGGHYAVKSLSFITNAKNYGSFGSEAGGTPFSLLMKEGGAIVGFRGHSGLYLDAIGIYL